MHAVYICPRSYSWYSIYDDRSGGQAAPHEGPNSGHDCNCAPERCTHGVKYWEIIKLGPAGWAQALPGMSAWYCSSLLSAPTLSLKALPLIAGAHPRECPTSTIRCLSPAALSKALTKIPASNAVLPAAAITANLSTKPCMQSYPCYKASVGMCACTLSSSQRECNHQQKHQWQQYLKAWLGPRSKHIMFLGDSHSPLCMYNRWWPCYIHTWCASCGRLPRSGRCFAQALNGFMLLSALVFQSWALCEPGKAKYVVAGSAKLNAVYLVSSLHPSAGWDL